VTILRDDNKAPTPETPWFSLIRRGTFFPSHVLGDGRRPCGVAFTHIAMRRLRAQATA
jgi:hypothetical protein